MILFLSLLDIYSVHVKHLLNLLGLQLGRITTLRNLPLYKYNNYYDFFLILIFAKEKMYPFVIFKKAMKTSINMCVKGILTHIIHIGYKNDACKTAYVCMSLLEYEMCHFI
jgi:hypothetical protein